MLHNGHCLPITLSKYIIVQECVLIDLCTDKAPFNNFRYKIPFFDVTPVLITAEKPAYAARW